MACACLLPCFVGEPRRGRLANWQTDEIRAQGTMGEKPGDKRRDEPELESETLLSWSEICPKNGYPVEDFEKDGLPAFRCRTWHEA